jgi:outer membrane protein TolC
MNATVLLAALALASQPPARTLTYGDAIAEALARNSDLRAARARLEQARAIGWKAWAGQLPQVSAGASWTRSDKGVEIPAAPPLLPDAIVLQPLLAKGAQVQATLPVFAPQLWFGIAAAEAGQRQSEWTTEAARRDILFRVAELYYGAVAGKFASQIAERQLAVAMAHETDARIRRRVGSTPAVALLRAEIDRAQAEQGLTLARAGYDAAREALATVLDRRADFEVEAPGEPPAPLAGAELDPSGLHDRPDFRAAQAGLETAERARAAFRASYLPSASAFARGQWQDPPGIAAERRSWAVGVALTWNLFDGTLREAQLHESGAKVAEAEANRRSAELKAREEVARARLDFQAANANRAKAGEQAELARENQRLVDASYREGEATYLEVSDANGQLVTAELAAVGEDLKSQLAALRLLKAAGRFDPR